MAVRFLFVLLFSAATGVICVKDGAGSVKYSVSVNATSGRAVIN